MTNAEADSLIELSMARYETFKDRLSFDDEGKLLTPFGYHHYSELHSIMTDLVKAKTAIGVDCENEKEALKTCKSAMEDIHSQIYNETKEFSRNVGNYPSNI